MLYFNLGECLDHTLLGEYMGGDEGEEKYSFSLISSYDMSGVKIFGC